MISTASPISLPEFEAEVALLVRPSPPSYVVRPSTSALKSELQLPEVGKVALYRDTVSVEPGSRPFFGSVSGSAIL